MSNLCIVNLPVRLEHTKDDPGEDPGEKIRLILEVFLFNLDARITQT